MNKGDYLCPTIILAITILPPVWTGQVISGFMNVAEGVKIPIGAAPSLETGGGGDGESDSLW